MRITVCRDAVTFKCIVIARMDSKRLLQFLHIALTPLSLFLLIVRPTIFPIDEYVAFSIIDVIVVQDFFTGIVEQISIHHRTASDPLPMS